MLQNKSPVTDDTSPAAVERMRAGIGGAVRKTGHVLRGAAPQSIVAFLVASALAPVLAPLVGYGSAAAAVAAASELLKSFGGSYIGKAIESAVAQLRGEPGGKKVPSEEALRDAIAEAVRAGLEDRGEAAAGLRAEIAALLERIDGVQAAMAVADDELETTLVNGFTTLGEVHEEFRGLLTETLTSVRVMQQEQRHQTDVIYQQLASTTRVERLLLATIRRESTVQEPPEPGECPYRGLRAFEESDARWFFGRERLIDDLINRLALRLAPPSVVAVVGSSGSGKSSLLRAGLLPALAEGLLPSGAGDWPRVLLTPGPHPLAALARGLQPLVGESVSVGGRVDPLSSSARVHTVLADKLGAGGRIMLVVDQFEETFALCPDEDERQAFVTTLCALGGAGIEPDAPALVVLGIRADFYGRCIAYPELVPVLRDSQVVVGPMRPVDLRRAIERPAARAGLVLEAGLVEVLLRDLGAEEGQSAEPGSLPLLSHALLATWQRREGRTLTLAGYRDAGGVREAIATTADTVYDSLSPAAQVAAKQLFLRLVALGEGTEDTRRRIARDELLVDGTPEEAITIREVLDRLVEARLIVLGQDTVEIAHEALIKAWPRLQGWLAADRETLRIHRQLTEGAQAWERLGRDPGALYRGARLDAVRAWTHWPARGEPR